MLFASTKIRELSAVSRVTSHITCDFYESWIWTFAIPIVAIMIYTVISVSKLEYSSKGK